MFSSTNVIAAISARMVQPTWLIGQSAAAQRILAQDQLTASELAEVLTICGAPLDCDLRDLAASTLAVSRNGEKIEGEAAKFDPLAQAFLRPTVSASVCVLVDLATEASLQDPDWRLNCGWSLDQSTAGSACLMVTGPDGAALVAYFGVAEVTQPLVSYVHARGAPIISVVTTLLQMPKASGEAMSGGAVGTAESRPLMH